MQDIGNIRVGRIRYDTGRRRDPSIEGYTTIPVLTTRSGKYGALGPYNLLTEEGYIVENVWQASKVWKQIPRYDSPYSHSRTTWGQRIVFRTEGGTMYDEDEDSMTDFYWKWRKRAFENDEPIRNPVPRNMRNQVLFSVKPTMTAETEEPSQRLDYIGARKEIYLPIYQESARRHELFDELVERIMGGENIVIGDVDGPHEESMGYYRRKYKVEEDFIENDTVEVNEENMDILLNDERHPFGHGYCLGILIKEEIENRIKRENLKRKTLEETDREEIDEELIEKKKIRII